MYFLFVDVYFVVVVVIMFFYLFGVTVFVVVIAIIVYSCVLLVVTCVSLFVHRYIVCVSVTTHGRLTTSKKQNITKLEVG